jgi:maleate cis-trans isomerase
MLGWRGYFGYVSPSTIQFPSELQDLLPEGVSVIAANLGVRAHQGAEFERAQQGIQNALELVVGEGARAVVLAGVPIAVRQGYAGEQAANRTWSEKLGVPVTSGMAASVDGLRHLGARRPVVGTAYLEEINQQIAAYLGEAGLPPLGVCGLSVRNPAEAGRIAPTAFYRLARDLVDAHPDADAIFLGTRSNLQAVTIELERDLGLPVIHGTQAAVWWALRQLRVMARPNSGRLLASGVS